MLKFVLLGNCFTETIAIDTVTWSCYLSVTKNKKVTKSGTILDLKDLRLGFLKCSQGDTYSGCRNFV